MDRKLWQDWVNLLLGIWLFVSPWALRFFHEVGSDSWNFFVIGAAIVLFAIIALNARALWEEWVNLLLGAWMIASPWVLGFSAQVAATRDAVSVGVLVIAFSVWAMIRDRQRSDDIAVAH